jgi:endonuclease/exonuclease/phosphatase family metal-dependent hydrolase
MIIASWNLNGATHAGRSTLEQQGRAWHYLAAIDCDIALLQEADPIAIPEWAHERWAIVAGEVGRGAKVTAGWGSMIISKPSLELTALAPVDASLLEAVYDYVVTGEIRVGSERITVASVHAPPKYAAEMWSTMRKVPRPSDEVLGTYALRGDALWACDVMFAALEPRARERRFVIGGDWNTGRLYDSSGAWARTGAMFMERARERGWYEVSAGDEQPTLLTGSARYQPDHVFTDENLAARATLRAIDAGWLVQSITDHALLLVELT